MTSPCLTSLINHISQQGGAVTNLSRLYDLPISYRHLLRIIRDGQATGVLHVQRTGAWGRPVQIKLVERNPDGQPN